jgi:aryl sulfotransferase
LVAPTVVRWLERSGRIDRLLSEWSDRREKHNARRNPFRGYVPGKQDVFVMTFIKSGTNWMLQIAYQLLHHCRKEFDHIHSVTPWPDAILAARTMRNYAVPLEEATGWETAPEGKRVIKTHLNWEHVPYSLDAHYIAVIRDPKDVFVSSYFFIRDLLLGGAMPSVEACFRAFVAGKAIGGGSWAHNAAGYWAQRHRPNVLVLSFAELKRDLEGSVRRIAAFLDLRVSEEVIQEACRRSSFEYMQAIDEKFVPYRGAPWRTRGRMMRRGRQGGSSELLSPEQQDQIDRSCLAELQHLGSDLPYDEIGGARQRAVSEP